MKAIFVALTILAISVSRADENSDTRFVLPDHVASALEKAKVGESSMIEGPRGNRRILMDYMKDNWRDVIDNLHEIAPSKAKRLVLFRAAENLPPNEFLLYLERLMELRENNILDDEEMVRCLSFSYFKSQFLEINIENPRVQEIYIARNDAYRKFYPSTEPFDVKKIPEIKKNGIEFRTMAEGAKTLRGVELKGSIRDEKGKGSGPDAEGFWPGFFQGKGSPGAGSSGWSGKRWTALWIGGTVPLVFLALALLVRRKLNQS